MDMSLQYLLEAQGYIEQFIDIPFSDAFFEDEDKNKEAKNGAINSIKNAIKVLITKVKEAIKDITEWIHTKFMSKEEKVKWDAIKSKVKSDKDLGDTKITIEQWEPYEELYDDAIKTITEEQNKEEPDMNKINSKMATFEAGIKSLGGKGKDAASRAISVMSLRTLVDIADRNAICAKAINMALQSELVNLEDMEKSIGSKQLQKYENKIRRYANNGFLHRAKVKLLYRKKATLKAVMNKQKRAILSYTNIDKDGKLKDGKSIVSSGSLRKGGISHPLYTKDLVGGVDKMVDANEAISDTHNLKKFVTRSSRNAKKDLNSLKSFIGK